MHDGWRAHQPRSNRRYHPGMRRMLTVALGTIAAVLLLVVVLFGRAHSDAIRQPAQLTLPAPASRTPAAAFTAPRPPPSPPPPSTAAGSASAATAASRW